MRIGLLCLLAAAVIFALEFFTTALDGTYLYCGLMLMAIGLALGDVAVPIGVTRRDP
jgi:hypothetical protein